MKDFFSRHSYIIIWISSLAIIGALAVLIFDLNGYIPAIPSIPSLISGNRPAEPAPPQPPAPPAAPSVTFVIQKSKTGNSFYIQWQNLPSGTTALNIFRGKTGTPQSTWLLWKTITLSPAELGSGSGTIDLGNANEDGYSFYVQAAGGGGGGNSSSTIFWTSSSTIPAVTTSTPPGPGPGNNNPPSPSSTSNNPPPVPSSTSQNPPTPTGTPYYSPQIKISAYGSEHTGSFWVQHVDQKIEIGWQNLPAETSEVVITRSQSDSGPWATVLTQQTAGSGGAYSIQVVDDTVGASYYYELNALDGSTVLATYGPVELTAQ